MELADYRRILKQYWGYEDFRGIQADIIRSIGDGHDTLGLMPTGGGKSITFQVPALAKEGLCLVVTPLIALMKDQVRNLRSRGIKATAIYSGMTREEIVVALENCIFGNYKFLYISPERLATDIFRVKLRHIPVNLIAIDEAHCISQWGYDFRPSYLQIAEVRHLLPDIPVLALTATATPEVVDDIQERLAFRQKNVFRMSFERKNLAYIVRRTEDKPTELLHILHSLQGAAIVYTRNRKRTKEVAQYLEANHITATFYHASLSNDTKDERQKSWLTGGHRVMVATNAFGMGIDKPDVRLVVHIDLPDSPEAYFQEAGRAGRDGAKAYAVLLCSRSDKGMLQRRIADTFPEKDYIRKVYEDLQYYYQMAMGDGRGCTFAFDIDEFCQHFKHFPVRVDSALKILTRAGYLEYTDEQDNASRIMFTLNRDELYRIHENSEDTERLLHCLLRSYTGLFADYAYIDENHLARRSGLTRQQVYDILISLSRRRILHYIPGRKTPYIIYTRERQETGRIVLSREVYEDRKKSYTQRIEAMTEYAESDGLCRSQLLLRYFGEKQSRPCGQCDACLQRHSTGLRNDRFLEIADYLLQLLKETPLLPSDLAERMPYPFQQYEPVLKYLMGEEEIRLLDGKLTAVR
ncbi:MAG: RecQ family ATP-dependent DNA helicase [Bacteroidales bacterium]|nr:RecQ family ATP-dependent DNA helicase [Bacteroidales bacterium]